MEYMVTFLVFLGFIVLMASGFMLQGKRLRGSCGGIGNEENKEPCGVCGSQTREGCRNSEN